MESGRKERRYVEKERKREEKAPDYKQQSDYG